MLAILSKETSMVFPLAILFAGIIVEKSKQDSRLVLAFVILGLYVVVRLSLGFSFSLIPLIFSYQAPWDIRLLLAFKVLALYFRAMFNLFEMPRPFWTVEMPTSVNDAGVTSGMLIFLLLLGVIWRAWKKEPIVAFGLAWFVIYFLPISNLKQLNQPMAEHWLYIPMIGLCLAIGGIFNASFIRRPEVRLLRVGLTAALVAFLIFAALVLREKTAIYRDDESFWLATIRANPQIAGLYSILGGTYLARQDIPKAKEFYAKALALDPSDFSANYMLGSLLFKEGQRDRAKVHLERITGVDPRLKIEFPAVAHAWEMLGDNQKALLYYRRALELNPDSAWVKERINMKIGMLQLNFTVGDFVGNTDKIIAGYKRAVEMGAELVVCSELCIFGYPPKDMLLYQSYIDEQNLGLEKLRQEIGKIGIVVGIAERNYGDGKPLFNSAALIQNGKYLVLQRKSLLPSHLSSPSSQKDLTSGQAQLIFLTKCPYP
jgi:tetratricopeptide (TPR) repeat protein